MAPVPYAIHIGLSESDAASLLSVLGIANMAGRLAAGALMMRVPIFTLCELFLFCNCACSFCSVRRFLSCLSLSSPQTFTRLLQCLSHLLFLPFLQTFTKRCNAYHTFHFFSAYIYSLVAMLIIHFLVLSSPDISTRLLQCLSNILFLYFSEYLLNVAVNFKYCLSVFSADIYSPVATTYHAFSFSFFADIYSLVSMAIAILSWSVATTFATLNAAVVLSGLAAGAVIPISSTIV
jgi:hypothetical protein